ncbi:MAG: hypothetical protein JW839_07150, partial [Candidatus Lokiarchaeota archaeon]|nr:hypothetical protein [Candidatus Lokiarchaeota archaeon]
MKVHPAGDGDDVACCLNDPSHLFLAVTVPPANHLSHDGHDVVTTDQGAGHMVDKTADERTLVLVKPDGVLRRQIGVNALKAIKKVPGSSIIAFAEAPVTHDIAKRHFAEHEGRSYFDGLMAMMAVPVGVLVLVVEGYGVVAAV